mgnify:CR=1 FL=1|tara:strand:+ start:18016 stop:18303 length:288 start_codon:yes stop_codon:yes gene_type:complete
MNAYLYILECANGKYYTGSTTNLEYRIEQHQAGKGANFTRKHLPIKLVYCQDFANIEEAFQREKQVQGWSRKKKTALINGDLEKLPLLSKSKYSS